MNLLATEAGPSTRINVAFRRSWVKGFFTLSLGAGGAIAIITLLVRLLREDPQQAFALLQSWGPWVFLAVFAIYIAAQLLSESMQGAREDRAASIAAQRESAQAMVRSAEAQAKQADALTRLADQGSKSAEEIKRLTMYAAQEFPIIYDRFDKQDVMLRSVQLTLAALDARLETKPHAERD